MAAVALTVGSMAITWGEIGTAAAAAAAAAGGVAGGVSSYQAGKAEAAAQKNAGRAAQQQANAQAAELERQARLENARAGIEQIGGEQEAEKRSRILAQDLGSMYANFAGNGLALDGTAKDTVGAALRTEVGEAQSDISTIRDNSAMGVWTHQANAGSYRASAANARIAGYNQNQYYRSMARTAARRGRTQLGSSLLQGLGTLGMGLSGLGSHAAAPAGGGGGLAPNSAWNQTAGPKFSNLA